MRAFKRGVALLTIIMMVSCRVLPDLNLDGAGRAYAVQIQSGTTASDENRTDSSDGSDELDASGSLEGSTETGEGESLDSTEEATGSLEDSTETGESGTGEDSTGEDEGGTGEDSTGEDESGTGEGAAGEGESGTDEESTEVMTEEPTEAPTEAPTQAPTQAPTETPTQAPTQAPTEAPTQAPTLPPETVPVGATEENNSGNGGDSGNNGNSGSGGIGGNGSISRPDTSALDKTVNDNKYKPSEPKKEVEEDNQVDPSIYEDPMDAMKDKFIEEGKGKIREACEKEYKRTLQEAVEKFVEGKEKTFIAQVEKPKNMSSMLDEGGKLLDEADDLAWQAATFKTAADVLKYASVASDLYTIGDNIDGMLNPNNEHATFQVLETTALAADTVLAVLSVAATVTGAFSPPGMAVSLLIGVASAFLHSEGFADWANSIDNGLLDAVDAFFEELFPWMKSPDDVDCYKPNIYLYSDIEREVEIRFKFPGLLTVTIPEYGSGWEVDTGEGGLLYGENGEEYSFLFYESITQKGLFQTEEGFEIPAEQRNAYFEAILTEMGFNETEIADFTAFWNEKLDAGVDYIMYPQDTETVDIAMPIVVNPMPESVERIWFVFEADEGQAVTEPEIEVIDRDSDYSLVEWGGMIFD